MEAPQERKLSYQDGVSSLALWWKSVCLTPIWGIFAIPVLGALSLVFVNGRSIDFLSSPGWQLSLGFTMAACLVYFLDDLQKRVIYISNDNIRFGLRRYRLDKLISMGVEYKGQQLMPRRVVLHFRDGRVLKLKVSRLKNSEFESFLRFVETRLPQVHIDPVMLTLMRCRRAAGKAIADTGESVEIVYRSRFVFDELRDVFYSTWDEWSRFGPVLVGILTAPVWASLIASLFMMPVFLKQVSSSVSDVDLVKLVNSLSGKMYEGIGAIGQGNFKCISEFAGHPVTAVLLVLLTLALLFGLFRVLLQANRIVVQSDSIRLLLRLGTHSLCLREIPVQAIERLSLYRPGENADPSSWFLRIHVRDRQSVVLSMKALSPEEKGRLIRAVQRLVPGVPIDSELLESMMPRQERSYTELWLQSLSSAPERKSLDPLQPGQLLSSSRYQVIRSLGVGGQGTAYLSKDTALLETHLSDLIVLKETIFPIYAESDVRMQALERFQREAELLSKLQHEGVVSLRDYFLEDHRGYLVMEHVDGMTLKELVAEHGALSEMRVRELAQQMAEILIYLHDAGVVHRDFTPDNLILAKNGQLKLIDFNVAQQIETGCAGTIVGKQAYLPPEQFRGKAGKQSDIYALGATLQYLLTGEDPEPITQSSPLESAAGCSESLDRIVRDCTALQLNKRIGSASELLQRLRGDEDSGPVAVSVSVSEEFVTLKKLKEEEVLEMENL